jgi:hypothetical protein
MFISEDIDLRKETYFWTKMCKYVGFRKLVYFKCRGPSLNINVNKYLE